MDTNSVKLTSDLPVHPTSLTGEILMFLAEQDGRWCTWGRSFYMPSVQQVFPIGTSADLQFRFMRRLQTAGLVGGCDCGCRGDYALLPKGLEYLSGDCLIGRNKVREYIDARHPLGY